MTSERRLTAHRLGRVEYEDGLEFQRRFVQARAAGFCPDTLLLLEHPPVLTLGRGAKREHIVAAPERLATEEVEVFETTRGGDVTYHGPGQIVGYPLFDLAPDRQDVRRYVRDVEESVLRTLARFGISAARIPKWPGVWVRVDSALPAKIAAIGVHISRWKTSHGFALNVNTNLSHFELIVPCGIREGTVTSMERELGRRVELAEVEEMLAESFAEVFGSALSYAPPPRQTVSVVVLSLETESPKVLLLRRTPARGGFWQIVTGRVEPGESPKRAAAREVAEETGSVLEVMDLGYRHAVPLGEAVPPEVIEELAFAAVWRPGEPVRLDPREHDGYAWVDLEEAEARLPYVGLRRAVRLAAAARASR